MQRLTPLHILEGSSSVREEGKVARSAKEFESMLLGGWLQSAEDSFAKVPGTDDEENGDDASDQMQLGLTMQPLGEAMAASGGIGIARMIAQQLHRSSSSPMESHSVSKINNSSGPPIDRALP